MATHRRVLPTGQHYWQKTQRPLPHAQCHLRTDKNGFVGASGPHPRSDRIGFLELRVCSGASWRDLPDRYGPWQTAYHRFNSWSKDTTLDRILEKLQVKLNEEGLVDLDTWYLDSTHIRASRVAAGAKKGGLKP